MTEREIPHWPTGLVTHGAAAVETAQEIFFFFFKRCAGSCSTKCEKELHTN